MNVLIYEPYKLFNKRRLLVITLLLALVCVLMTARQPANDFYSDSAIKRLHNDLVELTDKEESTFLADRVFEYEVYTALNWDTYGDTTIENPRALEYIGAYNENGVPLKYTEHLFAETQLYRNTLNRVNEVIAYDKYLDTIEQQGEQMLSISIFGEKNSYEYRNIQKSLAAYRRLKDITPTYDISSGLTPAINNQMADIFALVSLLMAVAVLIIEEKEKGLSQILRCTKQGGGMLAYAKLGAVFVWCLFIGLLFFGGNLAAGALRFGLGDLSRPIQSVEGFLGCTLKVTVLEYLIVHFASKVLSFFVIGALFSLLFTLAVNPVFAYGTAVGTLAVEYILYATIPHASILSPIKYINLAAFLQTGTFLHTFRSMNMLSFPLGLVQTSIIFMLVISGLFMVITARWATGQKNKIWSTYELPPILTRLNPFKGGSVKLAFHELYKTFISNKALLVILLLCILQYSSYTSYIREYIEDDEYYKKYAEQIQGPVTEETYVFLEEEQNRFDELYLAMVDIDDKYSAGEISEVALTMAYMSIQNSLGPINAFERLKSEVDYIEKENPKAQIVYDGGYNQLFAGRGQDNDMNAVLLTVLFLTFMISMLYGSNKASDLVVSSTKHGGGKLFAVRTTLSVLIALIVFALANLPLFMNIVKAYGINNLSAPIQSIGLLRDIKMEMSLLGYIILVYGTRLFFTILVSLIMLIVSRLIKNTMAVFAVNLAVFVVPAVLYFLDVSKMGNFLFNALISANPILR
ncbi:MAG TPA: hypothetical protein VFD33_05340 [Bacillota bacterium]|nr:hypothetical protein [Bacillota bacterium]